MGLSDRIKASMAGGSWIRRMFEEGTILKRQHGDENVFDLSLGNPVMEPPPQFHEELRKLANNPQPGMHRYMPNAGYGETRAAVAEHFSQVSGVSFSSDDIIMSCGAAGACNVALMTLLNPGDEVIIFVPYFVEYINYIENCGGIPKLLPTDEHFLPELDAFEAAIGPRTRVVIVNSPNNPTGAVYDAGLLQALSDSIRKKEAQFGAPIYIISDEAYRRLVYDGIKFPFPLQHHANCITIASHSKDLALPGERIGYIAVHPECADHEDLLNGLTFCTRTLGFVNAPALMQNLLRHLQGVSVSIAEYQKKRDLIYNALSGMGYSIVKPQGAFYVFPRTPIADDVAFVEEMLEHLVLVVPGSSFGSPGYFRASFCVDNDTIEGSLDAFSKLARKYRIG
jgi:aspartate aminotransferase